MNNRILENKNALIHGAGGAIGGAIARAFARQGARVFLAGRTRAKLDAVARDVSAAGGAAEISQVDALDEHSVNAHADAVAAKAGRIDIALNAVGIRHVQGPSFAELSLEDFALPIAAYTRTNFITAKADARHMLKAGGGVILTLSTPGSRRGGDGIPRLRRHLRGRRGLHPPSCRRARAERDPGELPQAACDPRGRGKRLAQQGRIPPRG